MELLVGEVQELKPIEFNYEELKKELTVQLAHYDQMLYSEDNIKTAKEDRANLNKLAKAMDDKRKEIKNNFMKPYNAFEEKIKECIELVEKSSKKIDVQVKAYEDKSKQEKKDIIQAIYNENIGELKQLVSFEKLFKEKWLNVSVGLSKITQEITEEIERIKTEYATLLTVIKGSSSEEQLKLFFFSILSLERTLAQKEIVEREKAAIAELSATSKENAEVSAVNKADDGSNLVEIKFKVLATNEQLALLSKFLIENNIKYGRVD